MYFIFFFFFFAHNHFRWQTNLYYTRIYFSVCVRACAWVGVQVRVYIKLYACDMIWTAYICLLKLIYIPFVSVWVCVCVWCIYFYRVDCVARLILLLISHRTYYYFVPYFFCCALSACARQFFPSRFEIVFVFEGHRWKIKHYTEMN